MPWFTSIDRMSMRKLHSAIVVLATLAAAGCASSGAVPKPFPGATPPARPAPDEPRIAAPSPAGAPEAAPGGAVIVPTPRDSTPGALALASALDLRGVPYRNGGSDPNGFDCSGLVQWVFARNGRALPA